jgi:hypothetical protein
VRSRAFVSSNAASTRTKPSLLVASGASANPLAWGQSVGLLRLLRDGPFQTGDARCPFFFHRELALYTGLSLPQAGELCFERRQPGGHIARLPHRPSADETHDEQGGKRRGSGRQQHDTGCIYWSPCSFAGVGRAQYIYANAWPGRLAQIYRSVRGAG